MSVRIERHQTLVEERVAVFSPEDPALYRYVLQIIWDSKLPVLVVLMLNPSTADHLANDPTIDRMCTRASKKGFGALIVLNVFAWRETDRMKMLKVEDPVGPENDDQITRVLQAANDLGWTVMVGWGNEGGHRGRSAEIARMLKRENVRAACLKYCANGQPGHPLYIAYEDPFLPWPRP